MYYNNTSIVIILYLINKSVQILILGFGIFFEIGHFFLSIFKYDK